MNDSYKHLKISCANLNIDAVEVTSGAQQEPVNSEHIHVQLIGKHEFKQDRQSTGIT